MTGNIDVCRSTKKCFQSLSLAHWLSGYSFVGGRVIRSLLSHEYNYKQAEKKTVLNDLYFLLKLSLGALCARTEKMYFYEKLLKLWCFMIEVEKYVLNMKICTWVWTLNILKNSINFFLCRKSITKEVWKFRHRYCIFHDNHDFFIKWG